ncbi:hypothetical protein [Ancylobacter terrae]|uniref:hypothetical protein n=1 Tax=Ancylobacter sp. sgz301288 TaxID=3342077 RepID=UPI00385AE0DA
MGTHVRERESSVRTFTMIEETSLRRRMEAAIESMLELLDQLEGDPDLEPDSDEHDASWPEAAPGRAEWMAGAYYEDAEEDDPPEMDDFREDDDPAEDNDDGEEDRSDWEPDVDAEPLDDSGIGDAGGLAEQCGGWKVPGHGGELQGVL